MIKRLINLLDLHRLIRLALSTDNLEQCKNYLESLDSRFDLSDEFKALRNLEMSNQEAKLNLFLVANVQAKDLRFTSIAQSINDAIKELEND